MDPIGKIRLCAREKPSGSSTIIDDWRYFRGQVAHFAVWDSARSASDVADLYSLYINAYNNTSREDEDPSKDQSPTSDPTAPGACPEEEPCDICNGPIVNPLTVLNV